MRLIFVLPFLAIGIAVLLGGCGSSSSSSSGSGSARELVPTNVAVGSLANIGGDAYFLRTELETGVEPWISDGTLNGTRRIMDIYQGPQKSMILPADDQPSFVEWNGLVYFAADDGINGYELWRTDGSEAGTALVADLLPGPDGFGSITMRPTGNRLYVTLDNFVDFSELWVLEATP